MSTTLYGYSLLNSSNTEVQSWYTLPLIIRIDELLLDIHCPEIGASYSGYKLVKRWLVDDSPGPFYTQTSRTGSVAANGDYLYTCNYTPMPDTAIRVLLLQYSADMELAKETGGVIVSNVAITTTRTDQAQMLQAYQQAVLNEANSSYTVTWQIANGDFVELTSPQFQAAAVKVGKFVQQCIKTQYGVAKAIANGTISNTSVIDTVYAGISTTL